MKEKHGEYTYVVGFVTPNIFAFKAAGELLYWFFYSYKANVRICCGRSERTYVALLPF